MGGQVIKIKKIKRIKKTCKIRSMVFAQWRSNDLGAVILACWSA
jgi:hypothetical protein